MYESGIYSLLRESSKSQSFARRNQLTTLQPKRVTPPPPGYAESDGMPALSAVPVKGAVGLFMLHVLLSELVLVAFLKSDNTLDDINSALVIIRNIP